MKRYLLIPVFVALALMATSCSLPFKIVPASSKMPQESFPAGDRPPEERLPEGLPPQDQPPEQPLQEEQPDAAPPPEPSGGEDRSAIFGWDYSDMNNNGRHDAGEPSPGAGSIMPIYEGPCPSPNEVAKAQINGEGYYRIDDLPPGTYCVGALKTVTLEPGQQLEVSFPSPP